MPDNIALNMIANRITELAPDLRGDLIDIINAADEAYPRELRNGIHARLTADRLAMARLHALREALESYEFAPEDWSRKA